MFVFYRYPYGSTIIDGRRIYGYMEKYEPVRVTWDVFRANKGNLIQASYNPQRLSSIFPGATFPNLSFIYSDLRILTWDQMRALCKAFGITSGRTNNERRRTLRKFIQERC